MIIGHRFRAQITQICDICVEKSVVPEFGLRNGPDNKKHHPVGWCFRLSGAQGGS